MLWFWQILCVISRMSSASLTWMCFCSPRILRSMVKMTGFSVEVEMLWQGCVLVLLVLTYSMKFTQDLPSGQPLRLTSLRLSRSSRASFILSMDLSWFLTRGLNSRLRECLKELVEFERSGWKLHWERSMLYLNSSYSSLCILRLSSYSLPFCSSTSSFAKESSLSICLERELILGLNVHSLTYFYRLALISTQSLLLNSSRPCRSLSSTFFPTLSFLMRFSARMTDLFRILGLNSSLLLLTSFSFLFLAWISWRLTLVQIILLKICRSFASSSLVTVQFPLASWLPMSIWMRGCSSWSRSLGSGCTCFSKQGLMSAWRWLMTSRNWKRFLRVTMACPLGCASMKVRELMSSQSFSVFSGQRQPMASSTLKMSGGCRYSPLLVCSTACWQCRSRCWNWYRLWFVRLILHFGPIVKTYYTNAPATSIIQSHPTPSHPNPNLHSYISGWFAQFIDQIVWVGSHILGASQSKLSLMNWLIKLCCGNQTPVERRRPQQIKVVNRLADTPDITAVGAAGAPVNALTAVLPLLKRDSSSLGDRSRVAKRDRYEGEELQGAPHGNGSMLYANGDFYRGEWVGGRKEGRGLQIYQELNVQYEGEWQDDQPSGTGRLTEANSSYYFGEFRAGLKHGRGQYYDSEGKRQFSEVYEWGQLREQKEIVASCSRDEEVQFPTLALDKERFTTEDLVLFERSNSAIRELDILFLLRYYGLCRVAKLESMGRAVREWSIKDVLCFLEAIDLRECKEAFYQNKIKGKDLLSLTERELKDDLRLKMGHRKRLINYRKFILGLDEAAAKEERTRRRTKGSPDSSSLKFRSATSMRKVLRNVKNYALYEESIQEESSESEKESEKFHTNQMFKGDLEYPSKEREYDSAAVERHSPLNSEPKQSSLEKLIDRHSECSETSAKGKVQLLRKDSKEERSQSSHSHNGNAKNAAPSGKALSDLKHNSNSHHSSAGSRGSTSSSSSSSNHDKLDKIHRKKTHDKSTHQSSEIRQLYEFLKEHRSLEFLIREKDIEKLELIGQGGFGKVYKGKYVGQLIAIKDYLKTGKHRHKEDFMKELEIISDLKHPNIVLYMGMCITANKYTLITEYLENGSLFDQLHKKKKRFSQEEQIEVLFAIVKGMVYLHNMKKILHRDLKSSNVLVGQDWEVKLCDFGLSGQKKKRRHKNTNRLGTFQWMAPEVIRNEEKIDEFADVYSFGVIIWELLSERIPYEGLSEQQIIGLVGYDNDHQLEPPPGGSEFLIPIMRKCLHKTPNDRPTFIEIQGEFEDHYAAEREKLERERMEREKLG